MIRRHQDVVLTVFLLAVFPAFGLPALQIVLLISLVVLAVSVRQIGRDLLGCFYSYRHVAFFQFALFFLLNALFFDMLAGNRTHYRAIALESWSLTIVCVGLLGLWLQLTPAHDVKRALINWLPVGLTVSFLTASVIYVSGVQGARISIFTPNPLVPPFWFLVLTLCSFSWFSQMSRGHKIWRFALLIMAALMAIYGSARLVMQAWILSGISLAIWFFLQTAAERRFRVFIGICLCIALSMGSAIVVDSWTGSFLSFRLSFFFRVDLTYESISSAFPRLDIWLGSVAVAGDHLLVGAGQINERLLINQELEWERWFRAHQTYLSYIIAGGLPALVSGLIMQSPVLVFASRSKRAALFPAFLGLGVVVTLNCFTDSIFQSGLAVQAFMLATLLFLRASDADQPVLQPHRQGAAAAVPTVSGNV